MSNQYEKHKYYADNELVFGAMVLSVITSFPPRITIKNNVEYRKFVEMQEIQTRVGSKRF